MQRVSKKATLERLKQIGLKDTVEQSMLFSKYAHLVNYISRPQIPEELKDQTTTIKNCLQSLIDKSSELALILFSEQADVSRDERVQELFIEMLPDHLEVEQLENIENWFMELSTYFHEQHKDENLLKLFVFLQKIVSEKIDQIEMRIPVAKQEPMNYELDIDMYESLKPEPLPGTSKAEEKQEPLFDTQEFKLDYDQSVVIKAIKQIEKAKFENEYKTEIERTNFLFRVINEAINNHNVYLALLLIQQLGRYLNDQFQNNEEQIQKFIANISHQKSVNLNKTVLKRVLDASDPEEQYSTITMTSKIIIQDIFLGRSIFKQLLPVSIPHTREPIKTAQRLRLPTVEEAQQFIAMSISSISRHEQLKRDVSYASEQYQRNQTTLMKSILNKKVDLPFKTQIQGQIKERTEKLTRNLILSSCKHTAASAAKEDSQTHSDRPSKPISKEFENEARAAMELECKKAHLEAYIAYLNTKIELVKLKKNLTSTLQMDAYAKEHGGFQLLQNKLEKAQELLKIFDKNIKHSLKLQEYERQHKSAMEQIFSKHQSSVEGGFLKRNFYRFVNNFRNTDSVDFFKKTDNSLFTKKPDKSANLRNATSQQRSRR